MGLTKYFNFLLILTFFTFGTLELSQAQTVVPITNYGAVGDGVTDNLPALNRAIADAQARGLTLSVPVGTFAYRGVIRMTGVKLIGSGHSSVLYALDYNNESIFLYGSGSEVRNLKLSGVKSPSRLAPWEATRITLFGATNFVIDNVYIDGSAAAGIQTADGANNGRITNNIIRNTLSDSIHMTDRASFITVENNLIEFSGDDGVAVVSYQSDGDVVHDIIARNNRILNNKFGRNMSVVGGRNVLYENNYMDGNPLAACLYLSQEIPYHTFGVYNVTAQYNTLKNCGSTQTGHATVMIYTDEEDYLDTIKLIRNDIYQSSTLTAVRIYGQKVRNILLDSNRINGTSNDYSINSPNVTLIRYTSGSVGYVEPSTTPAPSYVLTITSPAAGATVAGTIQVKGTAPGMLNVEVFNSAGSMLARTTPDSAGNFSASVDTTLLAEGVQNLRVNAWDSAAGTPFTHTDEKFVSVNVKNVVPSYILTITSPASGANVSGVIQVQGTAPGMLNVEVFSSSGVMLARTTPDSAGNFSATVDTKVLANGVQNLRVNAWDSAAGTAYTHTDEEFVSINVQNVMTPTVLQSTPNSLSIRRGSSFNLTYNFSGGPTSTNMRVFVHFLNSNNQIVFGDDHDPARATTAWSGSYSYTRRITVPSYIARGNYRIVVGLYDPNTGARMSLNAGSGVIILSDLRYQVGTLYAR